MSVNENQKLGILRAKQGSVVETEKCYKQSERAYDSDKKVKVWKGCRTRFQKGRNLRPLKTVEESASGNIRGLFCFLIPVCTFTEYAAASVHPDCCVSNNSRNCSGWSNSNIALSCHWSTGQNKLHASYSWMCSVLRRFSYSCVFSYARAVKCLVL